MALINIYSGATEGTQDGVAVSTGRTFTSPISVYLNAELNESKIIPLAIRTADGYKTSGSTTISDSNDADDRLKFCATETGTFADSITFAEEITNVNKIFYAQVTSDESEFPARDRSIGIRFNCYLVRA